MASLIIFISCFSTVITSQCEKEYPTKYNHIEGNGLKTVIEVFDPFFISATENKIFQSMENDRFFFKFCFKMFNRYLISRFHLINKLMKTLYNFTIALNSEVQQIMWDWGNFDFYVNIDLQNSPWANINFLIFRFSLFF